MLIIFRLCVLRTNSEFCLKQINSLVFITDVESAYSAVRTESLHIQIRFVFKEWKLYGRSNHSAVKVNTRRQTHVTNLLSVNRLYTTYK